MSPDAFIAFLSAYVELHPDTPPTPAQWQIINAKLDSCFNKVTPERTVGAPTAPRPPLIGTEPGISARDCASDPNARPVGAFDANGVLRGTGDFSKVTEQRVYITC